MALDLHEFLATLPRASSPDQPLPHDGILTEVIQEIRDLGYLPVDVRFVDGPDALRLTLQGKRLGTVRYVDVEAARLEAQIYGILNPKNQRVGDKPLLQGDALEMLKNMGSKEPIVSVGTPLKQGTSPNAPVVLPKRKRGQRGPDKKPRKLGGIAKQQHDAKVELRDAVAGALQRPDLQ